MHTPSTIAVDPWSDRLGRLVERSPRLWTSLGRLETRLLKERLAQVRIDRPVYIAGLARSGSTILLEQLARHPDTATHRYRDFPLVLTLWGWNWFVDRAGARDEEPAERAHKDRIVVTRESPEAFEEVVWMAFFEQLHESAAEAVLDASTSHPRFETFYRDHIRKLLMLRGGTRYLAKANYNVTRLGYLKKLFPDARFVVPIRDPVWHIASLMKQHALFVDAQARDRRVEDHMRRSGHFEFGLGRRPVNTGRGDAGRLWSEGQEVAGWALHWANIYGHVADRLADPDLAEATMILRYEDLCAEPRQVMSSVCDHCFLDPAGLPAGAARQISAPAYYEPEFSRAERDLIAELAGPVSKRFGY